MRYRGPEQLWAASRFLYVKGYIRLAGIVKAANWTIHKCLLPFEAIVGEGIILEHYAMGIVIHPQVEIGSNCRIYHHVTLAAESAIGSPTRIRIGNNVVIGAHSIVLAKSNSDLTIGDNAVVGASSVLKKNIPPGEVWAGNPARKLR
jgi:serine O-acetyltransferase